MDAKTYAVPRAGEIVRATPPGGRRRAVVGVVGRVVDTPDGAHVGVVVNGRLVWFGPDSEVLRCVT